MSYVLPGTVIAGRYAVVRELGQGATKEVFLADDRLTGAQVALALFLPKRAMEPTMAARFSREGRAASVLRSPYVVRVFDVGKLPDGTRYLATEPVLGRGLDDAMAHGAIEPEQAALWTMHVLAALAEAHGRGILHRDVKPENVLLAPGPEGEVAKLTDFGLAKILDEALEGSLMLRTAQNVVLGTPEYMPPEQWQGAALDARADVYATGVMLYEMLVGRAPFESKLLHALCVAHLTQAPPAFPATAPPLARVLEPVVLRALAKRPDDRFPSADAMRLAIESATGLRLEAPGRVPEAVLPGRFAHAELLSDVWPGAIQLVATPNAVLGRDEHAHVCVRCLPASEENSLRTRTVSRQHARIDWRGGRAFVRDLGSRTGTRANARVVTHEPVELHDGDELSLGKHVRMRFDHAAAVPGELPRWARLVRTDEFGGGQVYVLVLTEAKISGASDAAVRIPGALAAGDVLRVRPEGDGLAVVQLGSPVPVPLRDGQTLRVGSVTISVAIDG